MPVVTLTIGRTAAAAVQSASPFAIGLSGACIIKNVIEPPSAAIITTIVMTWLMLIRIISAAAFVVFSLWAVFA